MTKTERFWYTYVPIMLVIFVILAYIRSRIKYAKSIDYTVARQAMERAFSVQLDAVQQNSLRAILQAWDKYGDKDERKLAYILATAWHESKLRPIKEIRCSSGQTCYELQNRYWSSGYYGRGFVQLTWKDNYEKFGRILNIRLDLKRI